MRVSYEGALHNLSLAEGGREIDEAIKDAAQAWFLERIVLTDEEERDG